MQRKEASRPSDQLLGKPVRVVIPVQVSDSAKREQKSPFPPPGKTYSAGATAKENGTELR